MTRRHQLLVLVAAAGVSVTMLAMLARAEEPATLEQLITTYLESRDAEVQIAPYHQLARRYALDLTGVVPRPSDVAACEGQSPEWMFDHFTSKGPMPHTGGERPYVWINLLKDADHFLLSNSSQFSQTAHIEAFASQLRRVYDESWSYRALASWALESQMFLNRFPSAADRANAAFFLFLGRDSLASEVPLGLMFNGYALVDDSIDASQAETDPSYHVHDFVPGRCTSGEVVCEATVWGHTGATPAEAIDIIVSSPVFAEATVDRYWHRAMGTPLPGVEFPDLRALLAKGFVESDYDVNWLLRSIMTSPAYTQEMMYR